jgi:hypothetical protein
VKVSVENDDKNIFKSSCCIVLIFFIVVKNYCQ